MSEIRAHLAAKNVVIENHVVKGPSRVKKDLTWWEDYISEEEALSKGCQVAASTRDAGQREG